jgi:hypothetical protein
MTSEGYDTSGDEANQASGDTAQMMQKGFVMLSSRSSNHVPNFACSIDSFGLIGFLVWFGVGSRAPEGRKGPGGAGKANGGPLSGPVSPHRSMHFLRRCWATEAARFQPHLSAVDPK